MSIGLPPWGTVPGAARLPGVRLVRVPRDVESVTTVGAEADPAEGGLTRDAVEAMWAAAVDLYRSGVHPGLQLCVRRHGAVVLDRAIGHASGNGPGQRTLQPYARRPSDRPSPSAPLPRRPTTPTMR